MATSSSFSTSNQYIKYRIVVTENSYNITNNTSEVNVKVDAWRTNSGYTTSGSGTCYCTIDGTKYSQSITNDQKITQNSHTVLFNRTVTIAHNADGSKTISVSAYIDHARFSSSSQGFNVALTTIPRQANIVSAPNFYDTDNPTITYSNPAGDIAAITSLQACISLTGAQADVPYRNISKTGTSYTFNLTQAERNTLLAACPNSNTLSVRFIIRTVLSGQTYYSTVIKTMTVKNANPTITGSSYADTNATTTAITNNNQQIIQGQSTVSFSFTSLAALKYATLTKVEVTVNAVTVSSNLSGSSVSNKTVAFGTINSTSNLAASIKLTDSRGNTTTQSLNITMLAWSLPTALISCARLNNYYSDTNLNVDAVYSSLDSKNTITIQYQYKEVSSSSWSALTTIQDNVPTTVTLDNTKQWNLRIIVTDRIGSTTYNLTVDRGLPIIYFDRLKRSVGINTFPSADNVLESAGQILTSFKKSVATGSLQAESNTVENLVNEVRYSSGCFGSVQITTNYTYGGVTVSSGWYNFAYLPHRSGGINGQASGDNCNYGTLLLFGMTVNSKFFVIRLANSSIVSLIDVYSFASVYDTLEIAKGGTGSTDAPTARSNLGIGCTNLNSGTIDSSSSPVTLDVSGYKSLMFIGKAGNTSPQQTLTIPIDYFDSTDKAFSFTHGYDSQYMYFTVSIDDGEVTITYGNSNNNGALLAVYGVN